VIYMYRCTVVELTTLRTVAGSCSLYLRSKFSEASVLITIYKGKNIFVQSPFLYGMRIQCCRESEMGSF